MYEEYKVNRDTLYIFLFFFFGFLFFFNATGKLNSLNFAFYCIDRLKFYIIFVILNVLNTTGFTRKYIPQSK